MSAGSQAFRGHRIGRAHADQAGGELVEIGLADEDRAGIEQAARLRSVPAGYIGVVRTGHRRLHGKDVDIVLDGKGHAEQHAAPLASERLRFGNSLRLVTQRNENPGIGQRTDAFVATANNLSGTDGPLHAPPQFEKRSWSWRNHFTGHPK